MNFASHSLRPLLDELVTLSLLLHDIGKGTPAFQQRLRGGAPEQYRHEAVSVMMLSWLESAESDSDWINQLQCAAAASVSIGSRDGLEVFFERSLLSELELRASDPRRPMPGSGAPGGPKGKPLLQGLMWLILSHHHLPFGEANPMRVTFKAETYARQSGYAAIGGICHAGAPWQSRAWCARVVETTHQLRGLLESFPGVAPDIIDLVRLYGRPIAQLADHWISSQKSPARVSGLSEVYANTVTDDAGLSCLAQRLGPHLLGGAHQVKRLADRVANLRRASRGIAPSDLPILLRAKSASPKFAWQDIAAKAVSDYCAADCPEWFFGQLIAGTGTGKTIGALKIASSFQAPVRVVYASPLRSLTLQTGAEFAQLGFSESDLATVIGDPLVKSIFQAPEGDLQGEFDLSVGGGQVPAPLGLLAPFDDAQRRMIDVPVLVATLDTVMKLSDARRGGYLSHFLRIASADLIIDEVDMYSAVDLIAIGRLVESAGFWKCRIFLSSATLPPAVARAFFRAYQQGARARMALDGRLGRVVAGWFSNDVAPRVYAADETCSAVEMEKLFLAEHRSFVQEAGARAGLQAKRRIAAYLPPVLSTCPGQAGKERGLGLLNSIGCLHRDNHVKTPCGRRFSFGCVQVVNVKHCQELVISLAELSGQVDVGFSFKLVCLHGRLSLAVRNKIDACLNLMLRRGGSDGDLAPLKQAEVRDFVTNSPSRDVVVILLSTLETTGRDHDFDWGVIESRQERDIIQFAGRIRRHRNGCEERENWNGNLAIWDIPLRKPGVWHAKADETAPPAYRFYGIADAIAASFPFPKFRRKGGPGLFGDLPRYSEMLPLTYGTSRPAIHAGRVLVDEDPAAAEMHGDIANTVRAGETKRLQSALLLDGKKATPRSLAEWLSVDGYFARSLANHRESYRFRNSTPENIYWRNQDGEWFFAEGVFEAGASSCRQREPIEVSLPPASLLFSIEEQFEVGQITSKIWMSGIFAQIKLTAIPWRGPAEISGRLRYHPQLGLLNPV